MTLWNNLDLFCVGLWAAESKHIFFQQYSQSLWSDGLHSLGHFLSRMKFVVTTEAIKLLGVLSSRRVGNGTEPGNRRQKNASCCKAVSLPQGQTKLKKVMDSIIGDQKGF